MSNYINVKCGIYKTEYRLIRHKDGYISVDAPLVVWSRGTGTLRHHRHTFAPADQADVLAFFEAGELVLPANNNCGCLALDDILQGRRSVGVHVITL